MSDTGFVQMTEKEISCFKENAHFSNNHLPVCTVIILKQILLFTSGSVNDLLLNNNLLPAVYELTSNIKHPLTIYIKEMR